MMKIKNFCMIFLYLINWYEFTTILHSKILATCWVFRILIIKTLLHHLVAIDSKILLNTIRDLLLLNTAWSYVRIQINNILYIFSGSPGWRFGRSLIKGRQRKAARPYSICRWLFTQFENRRWRWNTSIRRIGGTTKPRSKYYSGQKSRSDTYS